MAENKNKIIVYRDWVTTFESLQDDEAGRLIKHFFRYVNDLNPAAPDRLTSLLFEPIKQTLKRDLKKYESICIRNKENGLKGGRPLENPKKPKKPKGLNKNPKKPDSDSDSDSDSDIIRIEKKQNLSDSATQKYFFIDQVIQKFKKVYEESNELPYTVLNTGKERSAAGKLLKEFKNVHPDYDSTQTLFGLSAYFDRVVNINDSWLRANMSLPILISKFNEINNILKNGKSSNNKGGSDKEFFKVIGQHISQ